MKNHFYRFSTTAFLFLLVGLVLSEIGKIQCTESYIAGWKAPLSIALTFIVLSYWSYKAGRESKD
jgi:hypothetical protein